MQKAETTNKPSVLEVTDMNQCLVRVMLSIVMVLLANSPAQPDNPRDRNTLSQDAASHAIGHLNEFFRLTPSTSSRRARLSSNTSAVGPEMFPDGTNVQAERFIPAAPHSRGFSVSAIPEESQAIIGMPRVTGGGSARVPVSRHPAHQTGHVGIRSIPKVPATPPVVVRTPPFRLPIGRGAGRALGLAAAGAAGASGAVAAGRRRTRCRGDRPKQ